LTNKKEIDVEETTVIDDEMPVKEKEVLKLNAVESLGYECLKSIFVGAFMIGDVLSFNDKKDSGN